MPTLDTEFYNNKIAMLQLESDIISGLEDFQEILNNFDILEFSNEDVKDYIKKGTGSVVKATVNFAQLIGKMALWCLDMIKKMIKFALFGFRGTIGRCHKIIDKIADRLPYIQNSIMVRGVPIVTVKQVATILTKHADTNIGVDELPPGNINAAKQYFVNMFNRSNPGVGEINMSFDLKHKPGAVLGHTIKQLGYTDAKMAHTATSTFEVAEERIKTRLKALRQKEGIIKSVVSKIGKKGYSTNVARDSETTETLLASFHAAILARDMKFVSKLEEEFKNMINAFSKRARKVVARGHKSEKPEEDTSEPEKTSEKPTKYNPKQLPKDTYSNAEVVEEDGKERIPKSRRLKERNDDDNVIDVEATEVIPKSRRLPNGHQLPEGRRQLPSGK